MKVETQAEADRLNESGEYGPYLAANGHLMVAPLKFPREARDKAEWPPEDYPVPPASVSDERDYRVGDEVRYESWRAWCAQECDHSESGGPPDW